LRIGRRLPALSENRLTEVAEGCPFGVFSPALGTVHLSFLSVDRGCRRDLTGRSSNTYPYMKRPSQVSFPGLTISARRTETYYHHFAGAGVRVRQDDFAKCKKRFNPFLAFPYILNRGMVTRLGDLTTRSRSHATHFYYSGKYFRKGLLRPGRWLFRAASAARYKSASLPG